MMNDKKISVIVEKIAKITDEAKTMGEFHDYLTAIALTIGGMSCHFGPKERSQVLIHLTHCMGIGFQNTAKEMGEPSELEIIIGNKMSN